MKKKILAVSIGIILSAMLGTGCAKTDSGNGTSVAVTESQAVQSGGSETTAAKASEESTNATKESETPKKTIGNVELASSPSLTADISDIVARAFAGNTDSTVIPVAYIGNSVDSKSNHYVLCIDAPNVKGAGGRYVIANLIAESGDHVKIRSISYSEAEAASKELNDGWEMTASVEITPDVESILAAAGKEQSQKEYIPVAIVEEYKKERNSIGLLTATQTDKADSNPEFNYLILQKDGDKGRIQEIYDFVAE